MSVFSIVVPAYNEEAAVQDILRRCLAAAEGLRSAGLGIDEVEVILVSDGSRDRTEELAREVAGVRVIGYEKNRGYGAAIKTGFSAAKGDWLGFIDADGTCDPEVFKDLLALGEKEKFDVVLGSRMHPGSKMPAVRVLGNWIFRTIVNLIAGAGVTDIASGMRVLRRSALERLDPLPDGMHFTPAMSVRAILDPGLAIGEMPMPYEERVGRSKLSVLGDGFRFLGIILSTAMTYRPWTFFCVGAFFLALVSVLLLVFQLGAPTAAPVPFYLEEGYVADWMFFRLFLTAVLLATAVFLVSLGAVAQSLVGIINREERPAKGPAAKLIARFPLWGALSLLAGLWFVRKPLASYFSTGVIPMNFWVFPVVGGLFALVAFEFLAFHAVAEIARLLWERESGRRKP